MGHNSHSPQIEAVRIPARLDGNVGVSSLVRVPSTCSVQKFELVVWQVKQTCPKLPCQVGTPLPVIWVT